MPFALPTELGSVAEGWTELSVSVSPPAPLRSSPWTNTYSPELDDGTAPSAKLRTLEVAMNDAFDVYRDLYFEGGVSSVYLWDLESEGFAGVVLLKKGKLHGTLSARSLPPSLLSSAQTSFLILQIQKSTAPPPPGTPVSLPTTSPPLAPIAPAERATRRTGLTPPLCPCPRSPRV